MHYKTTKQNTIFRKYFHKWKKLKRNLPSRATRYFWKNFQTFFSNKKEKSNHDFNDTNDFGKKSFTTWCGINSIKNLNDIPCRYFGMYLILNVPMQYYYALTQKKRDLFYSRKKRWNFLALIDNETQM